MGEEKENISGVVSTDNNNELSSNENNPNEQENSNSNEFVSLEVLSVIKQYQLQHGLKHGDYQRYRKYCTKRLHRIRRALGFLQTIGSNKNRFVYQQKPITAKLIFNLNDNNEKNKRPIKDSIKYLLILLICSERSWAYAMQCKQEINQQPRRKFHMIRRLRKSVYWSTKLRDICNDELSNCDAKTKLETCAYADYLKGLYHFELDQWQLALDLLNNAKNIYEQLIKVLNDEDILNFYKQRLDEIKPTLRYCSFNIGEQKIVSEDFIKEIKNDSILSNKINQLIHQTTEKESLESLENFEWLGKKLFIKQEKIYQFLLQLNNLKNDWQLNFYEQMIFECRDCLQLLRDNNQDKTSLYLYLTYIRLDLIIKRNLLLITTLKNSSDLLRQYEAIIGCLNEIKSMSLLLQQTFPEQDLVENFLKEIDLKILIYKAYRCYFIGLVANDFNWKESIALLDRCCFYCNETLKNDNVSQETKESIRKLLNKANTEKFQIYGENISKDESDVVTVSTTTTAAADKKQTADEKPLIKRLNEFINGDDLELLLNNNNNSNGGELELVKFPPEYRSIPTKPLFFDLALNHIKFPSLDEEINANKQQGQSGQAGSGQSGLTGMVKGWLGGWRK